MIAQPLSAARELLYVLIGAGIDVRTDTDEPSPAVTWRPCAATGRLELAVEPLSQAPRLVGILDAAGFRHAMTATGVAVELQSTRDASAPVGRRLALGLTVALPDHVARPEAPDAGALAWHLATALPRHARPARPISNVVIDIEHHAPDSPGDELLHQLSARVADALGPLDLETRPYGLSVIDDAAATDVAALHCRHVPSRRAMTRVRIYTSSASADERRSAC